MNVNKIISLVAIPVLVIAIPLAASLYTVKEGKQVIITQFGKPVGNPKTTAGLKIKIPFIQDVNVLEIISLLLTTSSSAYSTFSPRIVRVMTLAT